MTSENWSIQDRLPLELEELVAGELLGELSEAESSRLNELRHTSEYDFSFHSLQSTLGGVQLALESNLEDLPESLRQRIAADAAQYVRRKPEDRNEGWGSEVEPSTEPVRVENNSRSHLSRFREGLAWLACAAAILVAVSMWKQTSSPVEFTLKQEREDLLRTASTIEVPWAAAKHPFETDVSGEVVWNTSEQKGVMRFVGLPKNDPSVEQYQLWIIDPERDDEPIDGGVFDSSGSGEILVGIDPKLRVLSPAAFAITIEQPGGVVVSTQERLPLIAMVEP